jgi:hypothetical protein
MLCAPFRARELKTNEGLVNVLTGAAANASRWLGNYTGNLLDQMFVKTIGDWLNTGLNKLVYGSAGSDFGMGFLRGLGANFAG